MGGHSVLPIEIPKTLKLPRISYKVINQQPVQSSTSANSTQNLQSYGYNSHSVWQIPPGSYLRWVQPTEDELDKRCEYDMDEQDHEWLKALNIDRKKLGIDPTSLEFFEIVMDRLEKESFKLNRKLINPDSILTTNEDTRCAICEDGDTENSNAIVFCDGCNLAVHQDCYGVPYIPEGQWLCRKCTVSPDRPVTCVLCPNSFGAFKQTAENQWAHLLCAIHIPETGVGNPMYMEPVDGVHNIPKQRWKLKCYICKQSSGACIQCSSRNCFTAYHVTCAQDSGLFLKMRPSVPLSHSPHSATLASANSSSNRQGPASPQASSLQPVPAPSSPAVGDGPPGQTKSFCDKHTPKGHIEALQAAAQARTTALKAKNDMNPDHDTTNEAEGEERTSAPPLSPTSPKFSQEVDRLLTLSPKKFTSFKDLRTLKLMATGSQSHKSARAYRQTYSSGPPLVPEYVFQKVMDYSSRLRCQHKKAVVTLICKYWSLKREFRRGAPLLKRLHVEPWTAANHASPQDEEDRRRKYDLLLSLRQDLQQVKNLISLVCKREKVKLIRSELQKDVLERIMIPQYASFHRALSAAIDADKQKYFLNPVAVADAPDYYDIIKKPMDWISIKRRLEQYHYVSIEGFIADLKLPIENAKIYNLPTTTYHKAAIRVGKALQPVIADLLASTHVSPIPVMASTDTSNFPDLQQSQHFNQFPYIFSPEIIDALFGPVQGFPSSQASHKRTYDELVDDRTAKRERREQAALQKKPIVVPPPIVPRQSVKKPRQLDLAAPTVVGCGIQSEVTPGSSSKTKGSAQSISTAKAVKAPRAKPIPQSRKNSKLDRSRQASIAGGENPASHTPATPHRAHKTVSTRKRRRNSPDSECRVKKPYTRIKPPEQLMEEAVIEQHNPNATRGQLRSLKLRALYAWRIAEREKDMTDAEKARRKRLRQYIRQKRNAERVELGKPPLLIGLDDEDIEKKMPVGFRASISHLPRFEVPSTGNRTGGGENVATRTLETKGRTMAEEHTEQTDKQNSDQGVGWEAQFIDASWEAQAIEIAAMDAADQEISERLFKEAEMAQLAEEQACAAAVASSKTRYQTGDFRQCEIGQPPSSSSSGLISDPYNQLGSELDPSWSFYSPLQLDAFDPILPYNQYCIPSESSTLYSNHNIGRRPPVPGCSNLSLQLDGSPTSQGGLPDMEQLQAWAENEHRKMEHEHRNKLLADQQAERAKLEANYARLALQQVAEGEMIRLAERARKEAEAESLRAEAEKAKKANEERLRLKLEEKERVRKAAEEAEQRRKAAEEAEQREVRRLEAERVEATAEADKARMAAEVEVARLAAEVEEARRVAEVEEARRLAEVKATRPIAEAEAKGLVAGVQVVPLASDVKEACQANRIKVTAAQAVEQSLSAVARKAQMAPDEGKEKASSGNEPGEAPLNVGMEETLPTHETEPGPTSLITLTNVSNMAEETKAESLTTLPENENSGLTSPELQSPARKSRIRVKQLAPMKQATEDVSTEQLPLKRSNARPVRLKDNQPSTQKLRLILDRNSRQTEPKESSELAESYIEEVQHIIVKSSRLEKEKQKPKVSKSTQGLIGQPEFVTDLPDERDSFRLFNTGFILPEGTRRHAATPSTSHHESSVHDLASSSHRSTADPPGSPVSRQSKQRNGRVSDPGLRPTSPHAKQRPTLIHRSGGPIAGPMNPDFYSISPIDENRIINDATAEESDTFLGQHGGKLANQLFGPLVTEDGSSDLSEAPSQQSSEALVDLPVPDNHQLGLDPIRSAVVEVKLDAPNYEEPKAGIRPRRSMSQPINKSSKPSTSNAVVRQTVGQKVNKRYKGKEEDLPMDSRGFYVYPKAVHASASTKYGGIHPLANQAFLRLSQNTRIPEEGLIEDATLVWAKVPGHNWFPGEVGLPTDPQVPQRVLDRMTKHSKTDNQLLVMFFDSTRSWQWVPRRNTRYLGECDELDGLLCSDAFVVNKAKRQEIQAGYDLAKSNIAESGDEEANATPVEEGEEYTDATRKLSKAERIALVPHVTRSSRIRSQDERNKANLTEEVNLAIEYNNDNPNGQMTAEDQEEMNKTNLPEEVNLAIEYKNDNQNEQRRADYQDENIRQEGGFDNDEDSSQVESRSEVEEANGYSADDMEYYPGLVSAEAGSSALSRPRRYPTASGSNRVASDPLQPSTSPETLDNDSNSSIRKSSRTRQGRELC